jgi:TolA-binding protein
MKIFSRLFFILIFSGFYLLVSGQKTAVYQNPESNYRAAVDLFDKQKYGAAQDLFEEVIREIEIYPSPLRVEAEYYNAACAMELFNKDAEYLLNEFVKKNPASSKVNLINFQLGRLVYRNKKYSSAKKYFQEVDISQLFPDQKAEYYFKLGYCDFKAHKPEEAKKSFELAANLSSKYKSPATYYLAHMDYELGNYKEAYQQFMALSTDADFSPIVPFYIVQILFYEKKYDEVIEMGPDLLEKASSKRASDIAKIIGESYFLMGEYEKALPYLKQFQETTKHSISAEDNYQYGFVLYMADKYKEATNYFQKVTGRNDSLAQYAYYHLADCYLQTGQKKFARNAFYSAYKLPFDREIMEDALFHQAQLAYELSYDPYNEAIKALKEYLREYPNSSRNDEAYSFLYNIALSTKNYQEALSAIENIQQKNKDYEKNYQKISWFRGIELFNQFSYEKAISMFEKAANIKADKTIQAESRFWMGESYFRLANFTEAGNHYKAFLKSPGAKKSKVLNISYYNLGYVNFKQKRYTDALYFFNTYYSHRKKENPAMIADACLRMGDCEFISKKYDNALGYYDKALKMNAPDSDYALFQKALTLGILLRYDEKLNTLNSFIKSYPNSTYMSDALYESGNTNLVLNNRDKALANFRKTINDYPKSSYAIKAELKSGLIYYNSGKNSMALKSFKKVVEDYPGTPESKEALASIKNIYVETNNVDEYLDYTNGLSFANVSVSEKDSITYLAAENQYLLGNCKSSLPSFLNYLEKFPQGQYKTNASFYAAECLVKADSASLALGLYESVLQQPKSDFTESALLKAASISYTLQEYEKAATYFSRLETEAEYKENILEAVYGLMKCNYLLKDYEQALLAANRLIELDKVSDEMKQEAMMIKAKSYLAVDELAFAKKGFEDIVKVSSGENGAEAKYNVAHITYLLSNYETAESLLFELINDYSAHDYWIAKAFILLSDVYVKTENIFQAKQTLQSIIDNYEGEELRNEAIEKLGIIVQQEKEKEALMHSDSLETERDTISIEGEMIELN